MATDDDLRELRERIDAIERHLGMHPAAAPATPAIPRPAPIAPPPPPPPEPQIAAPKPALETRIGAHWLNRIGIAAVLLGVAFFLKYAFDNNWVGPAMRVATGLGWGVALLIAAELMRPRGHRLFAHTLDVIGSGILYLTIWAASENYALIGGGAAFAAMIVVTATVVTLAVRHRSQFLAGVALTGGFLTPILLANGGDHEVALFTYVALLDFAALVLLVLFPWLRALAVAFFGSLVLYVAWAADHYSAAVMPQTIGFATLFFLLFAVVPLLRRWDEEPASIALLLLPFANSIVYFSQLSVMMQATPVRLAMYAIALAGFLIVIAFAQRLRGSEREDLAAAHFALAHGFLTVAIPLIFDELWITLGWLVEAAALLAIAPRLTHARARVFRILGTIALILGIARLLFLDHFTPHRLLLNWRALTYAVAIAVFAGIAVTAREHVAKLAVFCANALALIELTAEVSDYFNHWQGTAVFAHLIARDFTWSALWMLYGAGLMVFGFRRRSPFLRWLALALIGATVAKVFFYDINQLERVYRILSFIALGVLLLAISFAYQRKWIAFDEETP